MPRIFQGPSGHQRNLILLRLCLGCHLHTRTWPAGTCRLSSACTATSSGSSSCCVAVELSRLPLRWASSRQASYYTQLTSGTGFCLDEHFWAKKVLLYERPERAMRLRTSESWDTALLTHSSLCNILSHYRSVHGC